MSNFESHKQYRALEVDVEARDSSSRNNNNRAFTMRPQTRAKTSTGYRTSSSSSSSSSSSNSSSYNRKDEERASYRIEKQNLRKHHRFEVPRFAKESLEPILFSSNDMMSQDSSRVDSERTPVSMGTADLYCIGSAKNHTNAIDSDEDDGILSLAETLYSKKQIAKYPLTAEHKQLLKVSLSPH